MIFDLKIFPDELDHFGNEYDAVIYKLKTGTSPMRKSASEIGNGSKELRIIKKSVDARKKPRTFFAKRRFRPKFRG